MYAKSTSIISALRLKEMGFTKIYDMDGGILLWEENKLKLSN